MMRAFVALLPLAIAACEAEQPKASEHGGNHAAASAPTGVARAYDTAMDRMHRDMGKASRTPTKAS